MGASQEAGSLPQTKTKPSPAVKFCKATNAKLGARLTSPPGSSPAIGSNIPYVLDLHPIRNDLHAPVRQIKQSFSII